MRVPLLNKFEFPGGWITDNDMMYLASCALRTKDKFSLLENPVAINIGAGSGLSAALLGSCGFHVMTLDLHEHSLQHNANVMDNLGLKHTEVVGDSKTVLLPDSGPIVFAFIDGDHGYEGATGDLERMWRCVAKGGAITGHDIVHSTYTDVWSGLFDFCMKNNVNVEWGETVHSRVFCLGNEPLYEGRFVEKVRAGLETDGGGYDLYVLCCGADLSDLVSMLFGLLSATVRTPRHTYILDGGGWTDYKLDTLHSVLPRVRFVSLERMNEILEGHDDWKEAISENAFGNVCLRKFIIPFFLTTDSDRFVIDTDIFVGKNINRLWSVVDANPSRVVGLLDADNTGTGWYTMEVHDYVKHNCGGELRRENRICAGVVYLPSNAHYGSREDEMLRAFGPITDQPYYGVEGAIHGVAVLPEDDFLSTWNPFLPGALAGTREFALAHTNTVGKCMGKDVCARYIHDLSFSGRRSPRGVRTFLELGGTMTDVEVINLGGLYGTLGINGSKSYGDLDRAEIDGKKVFSALEKHPWGDFVLKGANRPFDLTLTFFDTAGEGSHAYCLVYSEHGGIAEVEAKKGSPGTVVVDPGGSSFLYFRVGAHQPNSAHAVLLFG